jgi:hypothetical protein
MFKLALALCVVAAAAVDTEAPIINMDLVTSAMTCSRPTSGVADSAAGGTDTIDTCVETCQGTMVEDGEDCTKPSISAFDHHDGDLTDVIQFQTEFNSAGFNDLQTLSSSVHAFSAIDFAVCGKYTVTLEVSDAAGNAASTNEAKDTLIIKVEDTTPPVITAWTDTWTQEAECVCGATVADMSVTHTLTNDATCTDELAPTNRALEYTRTTVELCPRAPGFAAAPTVTGTCHDDGAACLTDDSQPDNVASETQTFAIADTTPPTCVITPPYGQVDDTVIQECNYDYNFCGSTEDNAAQVCEVSCIDAVSQPCSPAVSFDALTVAKVFNLDTSTISTGHSVAYTPTDEANNVGLTYTRAIHVVDTQAPVLTVTGGTTECTDTTDDTTSCATHKLCHSEAACAEVTVTCADHCEGAITAVSSWTATALDTASAVTGRYSKEYTCTDTTGNVESRTVIYDVYPKAVPTLTLISNSAAQNHWEATNTGAYTDSGATAKDSIDAADIYTHLIRTSGDIVNLAVEGTYLITYMVTNPHTVCDTCTPQTASEVRTVLVSDDTCPVSSEANPSTETIEAGFPYVDSPVTFSDSMDGDDIGTVSTGDAIVGGAMFQGQDSTGSGNTNGHCPASTSSVATRQTIGGVDCICFKGNTFVPNPATEALTGLPDYGATCTAAGLSIPTADEIQSLKSAAYSQFHARTHEDVTTDAAVTHGDTHIMTPCKVESDAGSHLVFLKDTTDEVTHMQGTYHITYSATDAAGNGDACTKPVRTIIVRDTLPPVITLQDGQIKAKGADESNPAWHYNPFSLMAEQTSVNGWMVGAVASFVAGVALVSFSSKSESYSVPV